MLYITVVAFALLDEVHEGRAVKHILEVEELVVPCERPFLVSSSAQALALLAI